MDRSTTNQILKSELYADGKPAIELLYTRYGGMLFSYILQFIPERGEAEEMLVSAFSALAVRIEDAYRSSLGVYCWLQVEARKMILEYFRVKGGYGEEAGQMQAGGNGGNVYYLSLLSDAPAGHQWIFRELFVHGRGEEELARLANKDGHYIKEVLKECLLIIRNKLG